MGNDFNSLDDLFRSLQRRKPHVVSDHTAGHGRSGRGRWILLLIIAIVIALFYFGQDLLNLDLQLQFFNSVQHLNVFWVPFWTQFFLFVIGFVVFGAFGFVNAIAWARAVRTIDTRTKGLVRWGAIIAVILFGWIGGSTLSSAWQDVLMFLHGHAFPTVDPFFHLNDAFFVFTLPFINDLQNLAWTLVITSLLVTGFIIAVCLVIQQAPTENALPFVAPEHSTIQDGLRIMAKLASMYGVAAFLLFAVGSWFGRYALAYNQNTDFVGLDATARAVTAPMYVVCTVIAIILAMWLVVVIVRNQGGETVRKMGTTFGVTFVVWLALAGILQNLPEAVYASTVVQPNAQQDQTPAINAYLLSSRYAWGLNSTDVTVKQFGTVQAPTLQDLAADPGTLNNVRIVDTTELPAVFQQTERSRSYQTFPTVTVDRYPLSNGQAEEVMLSPREISESNLPSTSFVNQTFHYTNGYGFTAVAVDQTGLEGKPYELVGGQPQAAQAPVDQIPPALLFNGSTTADPRLYCGLDTTQPVVVNTKEPEFEFPSGQGEQDQSSAGPGMVGISLNNPVTKLAASVTDFGGLNLLFTNELNANSQLLIHRQITNRLSTIAPFMVQDSDPYIVADPETGHVMYIVDGYVETPNFPESAQIGGNNTSYMRNAFKAVIDAKTCGTTIYTVNPNEPMTATYASIYPGLFKPLSTMPMYLREHLRYPENYFSDQAQVFADVHVQNAAVFFNHADFYQVSQELINAQPTNTSPAYVEMTLPGDTSNQFVLLQTFSPSSNGNSGQANNMTAMLVATCDYTTNQLPKLVSIPLNNADNVLGPLQFDNNINTNTTISPQLSLLGQGGSSVYMGNVIVLPFNNDSFLYVRPLYVTASDGAGGSSFPQLQRVIVGTQNAVAMGTTFETALQGLFGISTPIPGLTDLSSAAASSQPSNVTIPGVPPSATPSSSPTPTTAPSGSALPIPAQLTAQEQTLLQNLLTNEQSATQAFQAGNFAAYGTAEAKVESDATQLQQLLGQKSS